MTRTYFPIVAKSQHQIQSSGSRHWRPMKRYLLEPSCEICAGHHKSPLTTGCVLWVALEARDFVKGFILSQEQQKRLRCELRQPTNAHVYRRAAALLALYEGRLVREVAALLGVTRQTIYNWLSCCGEGEQDLNLEDAPRTGRPSLWTGELDLLLEQTLQRSPRELGCNATQWTAPLLQKRFSLSQCRNVSEETIRRRLRGLGYSWTDGRYRRQLDSKPNQTASDTGDAGPTISFSEHNAVPA